MTFYNIDNTNKMAKPYFADLIKSNFINGGSLDKINGSTYEFIDYELNKKIVFTIKRVKDYLYFINTNSWLYRPFWIER